MKLSPSQIERVTVPRYFWQVVAIHVVTFLVAPWFFTWGRLAFGFGLAMLTGHAVGIFHHMLLTHRSFKVAAPIEKAGAIMGTLSWRGPMAAPVRYVAMHRVHHMHSDQEADPHSPIHGIFHALLGWFWWMPRMFVTMDDYAPLAGAAAQDPFLSFLDRNVDRLQFLLGAALFAIGGLVPALAQGGPFDWENAVALAVYGVFVKAFFVIYLSNAVDVVNHTVGYRNYETKDLSTNSALMGMIHLGGAVSWHNNHHAHPAYFKVKKQWWEIDVHYLSLKGLEKLGLASDIKVLDESLPMTVEGLA